MEDMYDTYEKLINRQKIILVIFGKQDAHIPCDSTIDIITTILPDVEIALVNQAGHHVFLEKENEVNNNILRFIKK